MNDHDAFLAFIHTQIPSARGPIEPPATVEGWNDRLAAVRKGLTRAFGRMPEKPCPLDPETLGTLKREGYVIERLTFQSRPGVRVTANVYRPEPVAGRLPAVLSVHGHWPWARIDPHVQARCIGLAKLGYLCMAVDAFGAGERAIEPAPGTYHGALVGASLWPTGLTLQGLQINDNRRAVDYLISRSDVDPDRLAITGASGGGNQSLYSGATDDRFKAVVPVCGVGTFEAYLGIACCVCEVFLGGLKIATAGDLLAMMAPRALMVISATKDAFQFSVGEAAKSISYARNRYRLLGVEDRIKHVAIEAGHDYNQEMREAMYGWLDRWLRDRGDGSPVPEPKLALEDPQDLRCYPDGPSRPKTIVTIPQLAWTEGQTRLAALPPAPDHPEEWEALSERMLADLREEILGGFPEPPRTPVKNPVPADGDGPRVRELEIEPEPGLKLAGRWVRPEAGSWRGKILLLRPEGMAAAEDPLVQDLLKTGWGVLTADLRATGKGKPKTNPVVGVADHNEAEWSLWIGRPLAGQWTYDALSWLRVLAAIGQPDPADRRTAVPARVRRLGVVGLGPLGLVGLLAALYEPRVRAVGLGKTLVSFSSESPWQNVPMSLILPSLFEIGDVSRLAALLAPRPLVVAGGILPTGQIASEPVLRERFAFTRAVYDMLPAPEKLVIQAELEPTRIVEAWALSDES